MKVKPSKAVNKNPTDAVSWPQLPKLRAGTGSQSACAMAASPWEKKQAKTSKTNFGILLKNTRLKTVDEVAT